MQQRPDIDQLYRTMTIIWLVLLFSQLALFGVAWSVGREAAEANLEHGFLSPMPLIVVGAVVLAFTNLAISLILRRKCNEQAVAEQNVRLVQTGLIIGCRCASRSRSIGMLLLFAFAIPVLLLLVRPRHPRNFSSLPPSSGSDQRKFQINQKTFFAAGNLFLTSCV